MSDSYEMRIGDLEDEIEVLTKDNAKLKECLESVTNDLGHANNQHFESRHRWRIVLRALGEARKCLIGLKQ